MQEEERGEMHGKDKENREEEEGQKDLWHRIRKEIQNH